VGQSKESHPVMTYRVRFRFRLQKKLQLDQKEYRFQIEGHEVVLSPQTTDLNISDSNWLVMNVREFDSEREAQAFGQKLKSACELSSVASRLGLDSGIDLPTTGLSQLARDRVREESGFHVRDNIHGLDVFPDDPAVRIIQWSAKGTVRALPDRFLGDLSRLFEASNPISQQTKDIVLLLNYALLRSEPVVQIVFAFSAVEMLGQEETWSNDQKRIIDKIVVSVQKTTIGSIAEREEVIDAINKSLHKLSLRQGVMRLLTSLNLNHLKKTWDKLYQERSTLVHGLAPEPGVNYGDLAHKSVNLCGHILLTAISREIPEATKYIDVLYEV
jgi:hypothetical protein